MTAPGIVLVHGSMHGAWCWDRVVPHLVDHGIPTIAVDLPGRGVNENATVGLSASTAVVRDAVAELGAHAVICAHSSGGLPGWLAADARSVRHLVLIAALVPRENQAAAAVMATTGHRLVVDGAGIRLRDRADAAEIFYNDCDDDTITWACGRLMPEPLPHDVGDPTATLTDNAWRDVAAKATYIVCRDDRCLPADCQADLASRMAHSVELASGHSPFLSRPKAVAGLLVRIARQSR